ncbi:hypothetical protein EUX98_g3454 [Antrodiella citrinella]|uniref:Transcription factor domain-containing protein n=1 Tax=Antrodiella citrinella TaxID=2447956 RepID=A0A4S4MWH4_9APHY|nr:hypothetical protein EUX98_g3454 [Antrodiella citrinella]
MRMDPIDVVDVAAQSHVPTRPTRLSVLVEDLDAYTEPSRDTAYSLGSSSGSSHNPVSPSHYPPPRQEPIGHRPDPLIVTPSQDIAQFAQAPLYYKSAESVLTYVGHVPSAVISAPSDEYGYENDKNEHKPQIGAEPSLHFTRDTWWDALLSFYSGRSYGRAANSTTLTSAERDSTVQQVLTDLQQLFRASNYWFSFLNVSRFFTRLLDPLQRQRMQPSLVLGALAVSVFIHSSEREGGQKGRAWAMRLRDEAQSALEASVSTRSIDASLVHAAWLISFFEICAHPYHSSNRVQSTFAMLDSLIRTLSLTQVDKEDARVTTFASQLVPIVSSAPHTGPHLSHWDASTSQLHAEETASPCTCASYTLGHINPMAQQVTPLWLTTPAWGANWSEAEITKEECRRVVWSSMMLSAGHSSYTAANGSFSQMDLFINNPSNASDCMCQETIQC